MKKIAAMLLAVLMVFSLAACSDNRAGANAGASNSESTATSTGSASGESSSESVSSSAGAESSDGEGTPDQLQPESSSAPAEDNNADAVPILVAYFSATHTTEGVAQTIANSLGADLYEIVPEQPYTDADLDYHDDNSRSTLEMNDPNARPAISGSVEHMEQYDIVFIGYPIWWGEAPRILSTFVESCDFSGKTIVPFCTSGGSGVGASASHLEELSSGATWLAGTRLNGNASPDSIAEWINGLELEIPAP